MEDNRLASAVEETALCPVCKAKQPWSDTCRRCKCDLSLLHRAEITCRQTRRRCLLLLREGRCRDALRSARRLYALRPDHPAARLLAVCHLVHGSWLKAIGLPYTPGRSDR